MWFASAWSLLVSPRGCSLFFCLCLPSLYGFDFVVLRSPRILLPFVLWFSLSPFGWPPYLSCLGSPLSLVIRLLLILIRLPLCGGFSFSSRLFWCVLLSLRCLPSSSRPYRPLHCCFAAFCFRLAFRFLSASLLFGMWEVAFVALFLFAPPSSSPPFRVGR